jgi:DNA-directed RNA polymerase specialized sigma24 family protein
MRKQYSCEFIQKAKINSKAMNELLSVIFLDAKSIFKSYYDGYIDPEDFAQDVSLKLYFHLQKEDSFFEDGSFPRYLSRTCSNHFIDYYRKQKSKFFMTSFRSIDEHVISYEQDTPETTCMYNDLISFIFEHISLTPKKKNIYNLMFLDLHIERLLLLLVLKKNL